MPPPSEPSSESQVLSVAFLRVWLVLRVEGKLWSGGSLRGPRARVGRLSEGSEGAMREGSPPVRRWGLIMSDEGENYRACFFPNVGGSVLQPWPFSAPPPHPSLRPQASAWAAVSGGGEV